MVTNRIYLRNRKFIKRSESSKNELHKINNMEIFTNRNIKHKIIAGKFSIEEITPPMGCMRTRNSPSTSKRVQFDSTLFLCRAELKKHRVLMKKSECRGVDHGKFKDRYVRKPVTTSCETGSQLGNCTVYCVRLVQAELSM